MKSRRQGPNAAMSPRGKSRPQGMPMQMPQQAMAAQQMQRPMQGMGVAPQMPPQAQVGPSQMAPNPEQAKGMYDAMQNAQGPVAGQQLSPLAPPPQGKSARQPDPRLLAQALRARDQGMMQ